MLKKTFLLSCVILAMEAQASEETSPDRQDEAVLLGKRRISINHEEESPNKRRRLSDEESVPPLVDPAKYDIPTSIIYSDNQIFRPILPKSFNLHQNVLPLRNEEQNLARRLQKRGSSKFKNAYPPQPPQASQYNGYSMAARDYLRKHHENYYYYRLYAELMVAGYEESIIQTIFEDVTGVPKRTTRKYRDQAVKAGYLAPPTNKN